MIKQDDITLATQLANSPASHQFSAGRSPLLQVESLSKSYSDVQVLHDISLQINPGEILGQVGPNGAGKTTLMETLQGVHPFKGLISVCGEVIQQGLSQGVKQPLGVAPQFFSLPSLLRVEAQRKIRFSRLSGGQKRRLAGFPGGASLAGEPLDADAGK
ncbi:ATP-binding cassette domain-containing protein [Erwinia persicina]|uniref:ATP-binding cassette domain-containing protein n=1 Tax=Erwinia persicina TaxID=55211 RepID=UPI001785FEBA|nr:ATP-binding cassette domain-containing protein [Erwinia persicina]MBD8215692.1 ATP-binding cassette domain-containing protein [Erwinia persicina]